MGNANHPLGNGRWGAFNGVIGFVKMLGVAYGIYFIMTSCVDCNDGFEINGIKVPLAMFVFPMAWLVYTHEGYVSRIRPDTWPFQWLDLIGSFICTAVITVAALSWAPPFALLLAKFGLPSANFSLLTLAVVISFLPAAWYDLIFNQIQVALHGREDEEDEAPLDVTKLRIAFQPDAIRELGRACGEAVAAKLESILEKIEKKLP